MILSVFVVNASPRKSAGIAKVEIRTYTIIYELIEDIEKAVKGMLEPKFEESHLGTVEIRQVFKLSRKGIIAGCHVLDGKITRNANKPRNAKRPIMKIVRNIAICS